MTLILDGRIEQEKLSTHIQKDVLSLQSKFHITPKLAIIMIGHNPASEIYISKKQDFAKQVGIKTTLHALEESSSLETCLKLIASLNQDGAVYGIILQLPIPKHLDASKLIEAISPLKDVDGLHPINVGNLQHNKKGLYPCTPQGCLHLIHTWKKDLSGMLAVVIGRSHLVGHPISVLLSHENATVIKAHSRTKNLQALTQQADILVVAAGCPGLITEGFVKKGACVIDVGISKDASENTVGDVDYPSVAPKAGAISPVPGGVGPMTVTYLMMNVIKAAKNSVDLQ